MRPEALVQCGRMGLDPTVAGGVVDGSTAVGEHGLEPAAADREPQAPARRPQDALGREPPALARVRPAARHAASLLVGAAGSTRSQPVGKLGSGASWHSVPFGKAARAIRRVSSGIGYPSSACNDIDLSSMSGQCRGSLMEGGRGEFATRVANWSDPGPLPCSSRATSNGQNRVVLTSELSQARRQLHDNARGWDGRLGRPEDEPLW
jgi:hypothetical protein